MSVPGLTVLDSGCDFITATVQREEGRWQEVQNHWCDLLHRAREDSGLVEDVGMQGYVGLLAGKVFWGTRWDGSLLRITGGDAQQYFDEWREATGKPTRLDFQVTIRAGSEYHTLLREAKEAADAANLRLAEGRRRLVKTVEDNRFGHTLYIGSRKSKTFGRIYHKWPVDRDRYQYGDLRFEVELHAEEAVLALEALRGEEVSVRQWAVGYVADWFDKRGVTVPVSEPFPVDSRFSDVCETSPLDAKLQWLYNQVGPTARLLADQGHTASVFRVLFGPQWLEYLLGRLSDEGGNDDGANN